MGIIQLQQIACQIRQKVLTTIYKSQTSHIGSNLSCIDILTTLFFKTMKPEDRFILSKGHAAAALYHVLAKKGYFNEKKLEDYCQVKNGKPVNAFIGLVNRDVPGVEFSTGSLGHGLPGACGMAYAMKQDNKAGRVYVLLSDGEMDCGTTWESALFAAQHELDNLVVIVDYNKLQAFGKTNEVLNLEPLEEKWASFGWRTYRINGHDYLNLIGAFDSLDTVIAFEPTMPTVILADTIKGKGVSFMEDCLGWHYWNIEKDYYEEAMNELKEYEKNFY